MRLKTQAFLLAIVASLCLSGQLQAQRQPPPGPGQVQTLVGGTGVAGEVKGVIASGGIPGTYGVKMALAQPAVGAVPASWCRGTSS
jgi:hypothetical protein